MSEVPVCTIVMSSEVSDEDIASLEMALQTHDINLQKPSSRIVGVDDVVLIATVVQGAAGAAVLIDYGIKVGKVINNWRKTRKEKGKEIKARLEHPEKPPLDLEIATDEEVEEWSQ